MKIALVLYGIPRCTNVCAPSIEERLLKPLRLQGDVSVVHHLWKIERVTSARSGEDAALAADAYIWFEQFQGVVEPPQAFEQGAAFDSWKQFGDEFRDDFGSLRNLMHQLQSLKRATALARQTDPDVVVFARPDLLYHDEIPRSACRLVSRFPSFCVVPHWNWWAGFNDRFAICGRQAFEAYGNRVDRAFEFGQVTHRPIHSESLVKFALHRAGVNTLAIPLKASRVRADGSIRQENFNALETSTLWRGRRDKLDRLRFRLTRQVSRLAFRDAAWQDG
jgi:hypothetical protein